jgi:hypothetical protein
LLDVSSPAAAPAALEMPARAARKRTIKAPAVASCEGCFFRQNQLCALDLDDPCATFRPNNPDGLRPPSQLRFQFRTDTRHQSAWAFPSADDQAKLHA